VAAFFKLNTQEVHMAAVAAGAAVGGATAIADQEGVNAVGKLVDADNAKLKFEKKGRDNALALI